MGRWREYDALRLHHKSATQLFYENGGYGGSSKKRHNGFAAPQELIDVRQQNQPT